MAGPRDAQYRTDSTLDERVARLRASKAAGTGIPAPEGGHTVATLGEVLQRLVGQPRINFPEEARCAICQLFDVSHPDVIHEAQRVDPKGRRGLLIFGACKCRRLKQEAEAAQSRRYAEANLPRGLGRRTLDNFSERRGTKNMTDAARQFINKSGPHILIFVGMPGCGKSHLLEAIAYDWLEKNHTVRYEIAADLLERLRHTYDDPNGDDLYTVLEWYKRQTLLILDDLGLERSTPYAEEQLTRIVNQRLLSNGYLLVATNLLKAEMADRLGERIASRLYQTNPDLSEVNMVISDATSYRE